MLVIAYSWGGPDRAASISVERRGPASKYGGGVSGVSGAAGELVARLVDGGADGLVVRRAGGR
ncbi:hypothetical protein, partial [Streptomyces alboverticillatus]|uniref:hypothetical protein n=1 Tax=Streptomyces alboverticillatus TaxID=173770 RepID=UPI001C4F72F6